LILCSFRSRAANPVNPVKPSHPSVPEASPRRSLRPGQVHSVLISLLSRQSRESRQILLSLCTAGVSPASSPPRKAGNAPQPLAPTRNPAPSNIPSSFSEYRAHSPNSILPQRITFDFLPLQMLEKARISAPPFFIGHGSFLPHNAPSLCPVSPSRPHLPCQDASNLALCWESKIRLFPHRAKTCPQRALTSFFRPSLPQTTQKPPRNVSPGPAAIRPRQSFPPSDWAPLHGKPPAQPRLPARRHHFLNGIVPKIRPHPKRHASCPGPTSMIVLREPRARVCTRAGGRDTVSSGFRRAKALKKGGEPQCH
jgi:hypothetical protein